MNTMASRSIEHTWACRALGLLVGAASMALCVVPTGCTSNTATTKHRAEPAELTGWNLRLLGETADPQTATFDGAYRHGEPLFLPAGAPFRLEPMGAGLPEFVSPKPDWISKGGSLDLAGGAATGLTGRAPKAPGLYRMDWKDTNLDPSQGEIRVIVLEHAEAKTSDGRTRLSVDSKSLGAYLDPAQAPVAKIREHAGRYEPPAYFATLADETVNLPLGDNLAFGQIVAFMDHRDANGKKVFTTQRHTQVLPPNRDLYRKLVLLRERLRQKGIKVSRFWITSGFRTPDYNKQIGGAAYSRHCFGDAVDLCIDEDNDKHMDDLNGDGKIDRNDGILIGRACAELEAEGLAVPGGIGVYEWDGDDSVRSHVHIDCRGYAVRWGQAARGKRKIGFTWWTSSGVKETDEGDASE
ncbi:MAG: hypothetical protein HY291_07960 [Planctomycetes bacterium]|nr:hypothetical protein [Planctomycetota bacterium]